jgi:lipopolysaccharide biosynthesis glycosyltransferase
LRFTVLAVADENYALPLAVMVRSLLEHWRTGTAFSLVIADGGLKEATRSRLEESWRGTAGWECVSIRYVAPTYGMAELPTWGRLNALTYARIAMEHYMEPDTERVLYLDVDMVLRADAFSLVTADLEGNLAGAAVDPFIPTFDSVQGIERYGELGFRGDEPYFNAGMLVVDLPRWREAGVEPACHAHFRARRSELNNFDQDALNVVLAGKWKQVDRGWQTHPRYENATGAKWGEASLYHFSGPWKPWIYRLGHRADHEFWEVQDRTEWRGARPPATLRGWLPRAYDRPWRRLVHPLEKHVQHWLRRRAAARA